MNTSTPLFRIRSDRFEVLQGASYVSLDRARIHAVHFHAGVMTVRYKIGGEVALDCAKAEASEVIGLLRALQVQRDRNQKKARLSRERNDVGSVLPGILG
jgi:hypothetical protein